MVRHRRCNMDKRYIAGVSLLLGLGVGIYFVYFHKGPPADIMAANKVKRAQMGLSKHGESYYDYDEDEDPTPARKSMIKWAMWIEQMDFVPIGDLFSKCEEGDDRILQGKTIMLPDPINGGVMCRTFVNVTLHKVVSGGEMFLECQYNGKELYSNKWDLCTVEEGTGDQVIFCPITPGKHKFIKDLDIPNYLPKGRYTTKAWMTNQDDEVLGCAFADFTL